MLLSFKTQLNRKNLTKLFTFLNYKVSDGPEHESVMSLSALEKAYRPHVFRLRQQHGDEKHKFAKLIQELEF